MLTRLLTIASLVSFVRTSFVRTSFEVRTLTSHKGLITVEYDFVVVGGGTAGLVVAA